MVKRGSPGRRGLDWRLDRCRSGCSMRWQKPACRWSVSRRGICGQCFSERQNATVLTLPTQQPQTAAKAKDQQRVTYGG
jgi:hypothetical protein